MRLASSATPECPLGGLPSGVWINLAITGSGLVVVGAIALFRNHIPGNAHAASWIAVAVLVYTALVVVWTSLVAPLLPSDLLVNAAFEHVALTLTALTAAGVAVASWAGR